MSCCGRPRTLSPPKSVSPSPDQDQNVKHEVLLRIPGCKVHLMDEGEALELAAGDFQVIRISDEGVLLATIVKVGDELQWPLTKDEPVVKMDGHHYLFSLPMKEEKPLSYGVEFSNNPNLRLLDSFLKENSLFTCPNNSSGKEIDWKKFAPVVDDYNNFLARTIAGGTGQIVKGIFMCSNAYTNQVHKGGETMLIRAANDKSLIPAKETQSYANNGGDPKKRGSLNNSLKRVRNLSKMTEKMSKTMLKVVGVANDTVMGPVVRSAAGKKFFSMVPGEVLLASLDAVNKILDAAEAAERQAMAATSGAVTRMVTERYGESAGEATENAMATVGHAAGTAWNVVKIRKAINPKPSHLLKNATLKP